MKLRYYKEVINGPILEKKKYLFVLTNLNKKINVAKIRMTSHELQNEIG